jgi:hypothetical protein
MSKNIILTIVVVCLFGFSGAIIYFGIFSKPNTSTLPIDANQKNIVNLLPYGEDLGFGPLENRAGVAQPFVYRQLNPAQDVGVPVQDIMKNAATDTPGAGLPNQIF